VFLAHSTTINATEGANFSGVVETASDADPASTGSEYEATIEWGDGSSSVSATGAMWRSCLGGSRSPIDSRA
jgi:hypothetical protein